MLHGCSTSGALATGSPTERRIRWPDNYIKLWGDRLYKAEWCHNTEDYSVKIPSRENLNTYTVYDNNNFSVEVQDTFVTLDAMDHYRWIEVQLRTFLTSAQDLGERSDSGTGRLLAEERLPLT